MSNDDNLPDLSSAYSLNDSSVQSYRDNGHALLKTVCSPDELKAYRRVINDATYRNNIESRPMEERDTYGKAFLQVMNLWVNDEAVARYTMAKRFAKIAADLMGVDGVRLYHDQALYKEAKGGLTPWHQDQYYWPLDTDNTVTMWMPLVNVPIETGALTFASGSHKEGFLGQLAISDESQETWDAFVKERGFRVHVEPVLAGDATFHSGWTLHSAPGNMGDYTREVMTVIFYADGTKIGKVDNVNRQNDLDSWLPGLKQGDLAASRLNPLVYSRS